MTLPLRMLLPGVLLACSLLPACGATPDSEVSAEIAPEAVDPAGLEAELEELATESEPEPDAPDWTPLVEPVPAAEVRGALRAAAQAIELGVLVAPDPQTPALDPAAADATEAPPSERPPAGALEIYLGILAANPAQGDALAGVEAISTELLVRGRTALAEGRIAEGQRYERIVSRAQPDQGELASYRQMIETAQRARDLTARGDARFRAGRMLKPDERSALAAYRDAVLAFPEFMPARDGLVRLQAYHLNRALTAAQAGEYPQSEQLMTDAARVLPDSPAQQDMAARIVEMRQARTAKILAQGHAAVEALDLELASRRLAEAEIVSLQAPGLDLLKQRIELARHYGRFRPGQEFRDPLAVGGEGPEMVVLAHGKFLMGSPDDEPQRQDHEGPQFTVEFERGFALARNETTVGEFARFVEATGYRSLATRRGRSTVYDERGGVMSEHSRVDWRRDHAGNPAPPELPVVHVAFQDAEAYVAWLSAQTGERYRLPSEAEFEYALRGGRSEAYAWGNGPPARVVGNLTGDGDESRLKRRWSNAIANYSDGHWGPAPVRSFPAEAFGTYDLIGNVSEWMQDCWHDSYRRAPTDGSAWVNPGCSDRVIRGASWAGTLDRARSAYRQSTPAETTHARLGFRVARDL